MNRWRPGQSATGHAGKSVHEGMGAGRADDQHDCKAMNHQGVYHQGHIHVAGEDAGVYDQGHRNDCGCGQGVYHQGHWSRSGPGEGVYHQGHESFA